MRGPLPLTVAAPVAVDTTSGTGGIVVRDVRRRFGAVEAVRGVSFTIARGETVALLGPNGAGKSTTIEMILGLLDPDGGEVSVFGRPPADAVDAGLVGGMLQSGALLDHVTVRELVLMTASLYPQPLAVDDALERAGISDIAHRRSRRLSGGQMQRVRFAMALASNADLLVLDEPTVGMDVESRHEFWTALRARAAEGATVLFATHYLDEADASADRIVLMAGGRIVADGATSEIKARVGRRTISATLPHVASAELAAIPGVAGVERRGDAVAITSATSDEVLRRFLAAYPDARDIEVRGAGLEDAFLELTATPPAEPGPQSDPPGTAGSGEGGRRR